MYPTARRSVDSGSSHTPRKGLTASIAFLIVLTVSIPWTAATKGADAPAVAALKYPMLGVAVLLAFRSRVVRISESGHGRALWIYYGCTVVGALFGPSAVPSLMRSARLGLVVLAVAWVVSQLGAVGAMRLYARIAVAYSSMALASFASGLNPLAFGRLRGFLPVAHPNNLGAIAGIGLLVVVGDWASGGSLTVQRVTAMLVLSATLILSGSRGSLFAAAAGMAAALLLAKGRARGVKVVHLALFLLAIDLLAGNPLSAAWSRDKEQGVSVFDTTLTGRTKAWRAVLDAPTSPAQLLVGRGLDEKYIPVRDKYAPIQAVHGAWLSAYFEGGLIGALALAVALVSARPIRHLKYSWSYALLLGAFVFICVQSLFESSLNDVSIVFPVLIVLIERSRAEFAPIAPGAEQADSHNVAPLPIGPASPPIGKARLRGASSSRRDSWI